MMASIIIAVASPRPAAFSACRDFAEIGKIPPRWMTSPMLEVKLGGSSRGENMSTKGLNADDGGDDSGGGTDA